MFKSVQGFLFHISAPAWTNCIGLNEANGMCCDLLGLQKNEVKGAIELWVSFRIRMSISNKQYIFKLLFLPIYFIDANE